MTFSVLSRYLNPQVLAELADQPLEPRGLALGNLAGAHRSPLSGFAVEFAGHREYVTGDDPRHIDWRVYYKRDRYFIKQYELETNFVCHLLLDISASMRYGEGAEQKLQYAAQLAATLGYCIVRRNDKVSLATFDDQVRSRIPPGNTLAQIVSITQQLDAIQPVEKTNMAACLTELIGRMNRREIVMVFSDFFTDLESLEAALQRLRYQKQDVVLFQVLHHHELTFEFEGMVKFLGLESGDEELAQTEDIRREYLEAWNRFDREFANLCERNRIERVVVDSRKRLGAVLLDYLHQRRRMSALR